jgi:hypothetical protein
MISTRQFISFAAIAILTYLAAACSEEKPEQPSFDASNVQIVKAPINPNGDSELALLMRAMYEEADRMKKAIERGEQPKITLDYDKILTAEATEPEKAASPTYKVHAQSYLQTLKALETAELAEAKVLFDKMVDSCMGCHTALCPGPKTRIKKLY